MTSHIIQTRLEQGQIVSLRSKVWAVNNVVAVKGAMGEQAHKVSLECLSDDGLGRRIDVIWEREIAPAILEATSLPSLRGLDTPASFNALLTAIRWSSASLAEGNILQAPFRGGVQIEEYQLTPVLRAAQMPRVTLLLADDVGLGKTIEAGLITQELIHTHRATRILIICLAHLKSKWVEEMEEKFGLEFRVIDSDSVLQMRREFGTTINPWASFPRLITSIDYIKTEHPRRLFEELLDRRQHNKGIKPWDLLIFDEAHNAAPSGRKQYVRDSDRTALLRAISRHFEHRLFLTATPHNGYRESFTGLLELLDNLRFSRGTELNRDHLNAVTVRRLKEHIKLPDGGRRFPPRVILPRNSSLDPDLYVRLTEIEQELFDLLNRYTHSRLETIDRRKERPLQFVLTLLKKRALSSPMALRESLVTHAEALGAREELGIDESLFQTLEAKEKRDWDDDDDKEEHLTATTDAASRLCGSLSAEERKWLERMFQIADGLRKTSDSKAGALIRWIRKNLQINGSWNSERVIIFTEYRHTLEYLCDTLKREGMGERILTIYGGMPEKDRNAINTAFQTSPEEHLVRILIATDAASEGSDFQKYCRNLIHYEIPWNPIRLEQRNGRIDRHGQTADEVRIHHFVFHNHEDSEFLKRIVDKVEAIRADLGSVGALVADNVRQHALGRSVDLQRIENDARRQIAKQEFIIDPETAEQTSAMVQALNDARRKLGVSEETQLQTLRQALVLEGHELSLIEGSDSTFQLLDVPSSWRECRKYVSREGYPQSLTFNRELARDRKRVLVVHLDHPLMRRALATLRSQMWRGSNSQRGALRRVAAEITTATRKPVVIGWGRLMLLGPERNNLHEGLVPAVAEISDGRATPIDSEAVQVLLDAPRVAYSGGLEYLQRLISPHVSFIESLLNQRGEEKANELTGILEARGATAERQARSLTTERMSEIRKTIKKWEKEAADNQLVLFDNEEKTQREQDLHSLRMRLSELEQERELEPKRQRRLYNVVERRVYPVALQIILPAENY